MSTVSKGNEFEARVYRALSEELLNERLCVAPKHAKIFRKKAYYSRDRQANIVTDVSVEAYLPDRERPTLVWIFECKDYAGFIPVDDIEEFHAKLQQIGDDNTIRNVCHQRSAPAERSRIRRIEENWRCPAASR